VEEVVVVVVYCTFRLLVSSWHNAIAPYMTRKSHTAALVWAGTSRTPLTASSGNTGTQNQTTQPQSSGGLFGAQTTSQPATGGLFGGTLGASTQAPTQSGSQTTSLFGGGNQSKPSLL
jgi:hypothetical protein